MVNMMYARMAPGNLDTRFTGELFHLSCSMDVVILVWYMLTLGSLYLLQTEQSGLGMKTI